VEEKYSLCVANGEGGDQKRCNDGPRRTLLDGFEHGIVAWTIEGPDIQCLYLKSDRLSRYHALGATLDILFVGRVDENSLTNAVVTEFNSGRDLQNGQRKDAGMGKKEICRCRIDRERREVSESHVLLHRLPIEA